VRGFDSAGWTRQNARAGAWERTGKAPFSPPFPQLADPPTVQFSLQKDRLTWKISGVFGQLKILSNPGAFEVAFPNSSKGTFEISRNSEVEEYVLQVLDRDLNIVVERTVAAK
jgi:hypothetical protein